MSLQDEEQPAGLTKSPNPVLIQEGDKARSCQGRARGQDKATQKVHLPAFVAFLSSRPAVQRKVPQESPGSPGTHKGLATEGLERAGRASGQRMRRLSPLLNVMPGCEPGAQRGQTGAQVLWRPRVSPSAPARKPQPLRFLGAASGAMGISKLQGVPGQPWATSPEKPGRDSGGGTTPPNPLPTRTCGSPSTDFRENH